MPHLTAVVAMDPNRVIGANGTLPWHLPEDLAFFKKTTLGHPIIMGRKTFESIGKPLPKRQNIVLTRDPSWTQPGVEIITDLSQVDHLEGRHFVIGGAEIYKVLTPKINEWLVSHVHQTYPGDTHLPPFESEFPHQEIVETYENFTVKRYSRS